MKALLSVFLGRRPWVLALLLLFAGVAVLGMGQQAEREATALDSLPAGADSTAGQELLDQLPDEGSKAALIVFSTDGNQIAASLPALQQVAAGAAGAVDAQVPPMGVPVIPADDGTAAMAALNVDAPTAVDSKEVVDALRENLRANVPDGVSVQVTGPAAIEADLAAVFDGANVTLLAVTAGVVAVLLLVTYRSPFLWLVPLTVVGVADQVAATAATYVLRAVGVPWDDSTLGILSVLVFGAGTNYALLLISRYRDELRSTRTGTRRCGWRGGGRRRPSSPAPARSSSVCCACCCRWCRPPAAWAWRAPSAS